MLSYQHKRAGWFISHCCRSYHQQRCASTDEVWRV